MKISEVIKKLQEIQKEHGDIEVYIQFGSEYVSMERVAFCLCRNCLVFE